LAAKGVETLDCGTGSEAPCDYPDFAHAVASAVAEGRAERGVMLCGSGVGACVAVNKVPGVRGCVCHDTFSARQGVEDDDLNVLCLGARVVGVSLALEVLEAWLAARFSGAERHARRRDKVIALEKRYGSRS
ncbi:MAG: RpiB/LacA/LacB family sugar-phosphate isomerase, partial [Elusimicrobia bacterium]|nr:RpiB/LacA/LacB family sugar-phosphate isomerase [Elusimicrobiota bacterium]